MQHWGYRDSILKYCIILLQICEPWTWGYWDSKLKHCGVFAFSACRGPFYSLFYVSVACVVCVNCRQKRRHVVVGEGKGKITSVRGPQEASEDWKFGISQKDRHTLWRREERCHRPALHKTRDLRAWWGEECSLLLPSLSFTLLDRLHCLSILKI